MVKKIIKTLLASICILIGTTSFAYVDDAGIMGQFNYDNSMYMWDYLNANDYRFYNKGVYCFYSDIYIKNDNSMYMEIYNENFLNHPPYQVPGKLCCIGIFKPGIKTDKGIAVGDSFSDVVKAYGEIYDISRRDIYNNEPNTGLYYHINSSQTIKRPYKTISGKNTTFEFYDVRYFDREGHTLSFFIDKSDMKVKTIFYWYKCENANIGLAVPVLMSDRGLWRYILEP